MFAESPITTATSEALTANSPAPTMNFRNGMLRRMAMAPPKLSPEPDTETETGILVGAQGLLDRAQPVVATRAPRRPDSNPAQR